MPKFTPDKLGFGQPNTTTGTSVAGVQGMSASGGSIIKHLMVISIELIFSMVQVNSLLRIQENMVII